MKVVITVPRIFKKAGERILAFGRENSWSMLIGYPLVSGMAIFLVYAGAMAIGLDLVPAATPLAVGELAHPQGVSELMEPRVFALNDDGQPTYVPIPQKNCRIESLVRLTVHKKIGDIAVVEVMTTYGSGTPSLPICQVGWFGQIKWADLRKIYQYNHPRYGHP